MPYEGRFINEDSLFGDMNIPLTQNLYLYVINNAMNMIDPSGHISEPLNRQKLIKYTKDRIDKANKQIGALQTYLKNPDVQGSVRIDMKNALSKEQKDLEKMVIQLDRLKNPGQTQKYVGDAKKNSVNKTCDQGMDKTNRMDISPEGLEVIANFELSEGSIKAWGLGKYDKNGNLTGIYPHYMFKNTGTEENPKWASDGGITFGYGHYVDQGEYNKIASERALVDTYAKGATILPSTTPSNGVPYIVPNSSAMPISDAMRIYKDDIAGSVDAVNNFLVANNIMLEQHQFDMLVSFSHQYGNNWWTRTPEKVLPKFIREGQGSYNPDDVIEIFNRHDDKKRRAVEASIFNNGYK